MSVILIITSFFPLMTLLGEIIELYLQYGNFLENLINTLTQYRQMLLLYTPENIRKSKGFQGV